PATGSSSTPRQQIAQALSGSGLDYLDLLESFQKQAQENQLFTPDQGYLTSTGHRLLAEILYQKLDATTALPRSAESSGPHETSAHR
ncbi:MAG: hypothetical protein KDA78_14770, partial [Planctomycetaceae bacterium]|nr:hypothetical protein [Planctomycetaceae bacterium]